MRFWHREMAKNVATKKYAKIACNQGAYVLLEDHGLYVDVLIDYDMPAKIEYVRCSDELHKLDSDVQTPVAEVR